MLTVEQALDLVRSHVKPLAPRRLPIGEASGLVLAEDITSEVNSPPYDKALMDGYAVRSTDREPERRILEEIPAGALPRIALTPGTVSRIMTGAPLPKGADAVVQLEQTEMRGEDHVRLTTPDVSLGTNTLRMGASLRIGDRVLRSGTLLRPIEIAVLAEIGRDVISVIPRPRVAVLPTGNELVPIGEKPGVGQIRNSNGPMLVAMAERAEAHATELGIAHDEPEELTKFVTKGLGADVLLLSGGVSAGKFDLVPDVLHKLGVQQVFHKIALRPGKPLWFGVKHDGKRDVLVFALPGNPVSSLVCFEVFVRPAIAALAGSGFTPTTAIPATLSHPYNHAGGRAAYLPARLSNENENQQPATTPAESAESITAAVLFVEILPWQGSADIATLTRANALAIFGTEKQRFDAGARVNVIPI
jgi:molybdopterin molybdotransferase